MSEKVASAVRADRSPVLAMALGWAVPGLGHFYLGRRRTAAAFLVLVTATFLAGLSFQGRLYSIERGQPLTILATFAVYGAGLLNIAARALSESPVGTILAPTYEYGCTYLLTAGLMNLLLILDVHDIARGRKP
jgi:TM2 domain-containing membrane protein YozV